MYPLTNRIGDVDERQGIVVEKKDNDVSNEMKRRASYTSSA
jgi:hypothetical protein